MMKNQLTLALLIAVLVGIIITGCSPSVGSTITFGNYNGKPIEWYIMDKNPDQHLVMLLAMDVLERRPYHTEDEDITWEQSTIRSWLNNDFFESAFTSEEKAKIPKVTVINDGNPDFDTIGGNNTQDYVFLLSINEVKTFLPSYISADDNMCTKIRCTGEWWLRSPGHNIDNAALVSIDGALGTYGLSVYYDFIGVRPALWMNY